MIVSASYRTDIPAFYGAWFRARLEAGFCTVRNPYGGPDYRVGLTPDAVDGFVFWTRNVQPFLGTLGLLRERAAPFVVQHTITGYPRVLDAATPDTEAAIAGLAAAARIGGPRAAVWRYDPIVITSLTPADWHRENVARLAARLAGVTDEVVVSFAQIYRKTRRNLEEATRAHGLSWRDPAEGEKRALLADLAGIAAAQGMALTVCGQAALAPPGTGEARCIDAARLSDVAGRAITAAAKAHRQGCACAASRDIGAYDSCPHGCAYCYAVGSRERAKSRLAAHDPAAERL